MVFGSLNDLPHMVKVWWVSTSCEGVSDNDNDDTDAANDLKETVSGSGRAYTLEGSKGSFLGGAV